MYRLEKEVGKEREGGAECVYLCLNCLRSQVFFFFFKPEIQISD